MKYFARPKSLEFNLSIFLENGPQYGLQALPAVVQLEELALWSQKVLALETMCAWVCFSTSLSFTVLVLKLLPGEAEK